MDNQRMNECNGISGNTRKLINFTCELHALNRLSDAGLIDSGLKQIILEDLRKSYGIISNLTAKND